MNININTMTYSMDKAKDALKDGLSVFVAHPDEPDAPINSLKELEGAEDHLFIIKHTGEKKWII